MYYLGDGVPKDLVSAYRWISLAAEQKDRRAQVVLDGLHRSLPGPVFTALVFPEPVVLGRTPTRTPPLRNTPVEKPTEDASARTVRYAPEPAQSPAASPAASPVASLRHGMNTVSFWKPSVFLLGNKPLP
jgi:TPR repeat protein